MRKTLCCQHSHFPDCLFIFLYFIWFCYLFTSFRSRSFDQLTSNIRKIFEKLTFGQMIRSIHESDDVGGIENQLHLIYKWVTNKTLCLTWNFHIHFIFAQIYGCVCVHLLACLCADRWEIRGDWEQQKKVPKHTHEWMEAAIWACNTK